MILDIPTPLISERYLSDEYYRQRDIRVINPLEGRRVLGIHNPNLKRVVSKFDNNGIMEL